MVSFINRLKIGLLIFLILGFLATSILKTGYIMWLDAVKKEQLREQEEKRIRRSWMEIY